MKYIIKYSVSDYPARTFEGEYTYHSDKKCGEDMAKFLVADLHGVNKNMVKILSSQSDKSCPEGGGESQ